MKKVSWRRYHEHVILEGDQEEGIMEEVSQRRYHEGIGKRGCHARGVLEEVSWRSYRRGSSIEEGLGVYGGSRVGSMDGPS